MNLNLISILANMIYLKCDVIQENIWKRKNIKKGNRFNNFTRFPRIYYLSNWVRCTGCFSKCFSKSSFVLNRFPHLVHRTWYTRCTHFLHIFAASSGAPMPLLPHPEQNGLLQFVHTWFVAVSQIQQLVILITFLNNA